MDATKKRKAIAIEFIDCYNNGMYKFLIKELILIGIHKDQMRFTYGQMKHRPIRSVLIPLFVFFITPLTGGFCTRSFMKCHLKEDW